MAVTVREIARSAKVSLGTVSRVLRGEPNVTVATRDRVHRAASSLNYKPLRRPARQAIDAPALAGRTIALVLLGMDRSLASLPVVAVAIHGAESAVAAAGGTLLLADMPTLQESPPSLARSRLDGVILKGALQGDAIGLSGSPLLDRLRHLPSVWVLGRPRGAWGDCVATDDFQIGKLAAEHLVAHGHRRLALLNPKPDHVNFTRREASFVWHAERAGATVRRYVGAPAGQPTLPLRPAEDVASVQALLDALLADDPRPTAVFAPADSIAALVYRALAARGLQAGRDLSVISANNEQAVVQPLHPALTTIDVRAEQIGRRAVDQLAWRLTHRHEPTTEVNIEPELTQGDSVANL